MVDRFESFSQGARVLGSRDKGGDIAPRSGLDGFLPSTQHLS